MKKKISYLILVLALLFVAIVPVAADDETPDSMWGEVLNDDGTIRYDNLIDNGVVTEDADWMPSVEVFGQEFGPQAEYHLYETPSGNTVQLPNATTLMFMALNPVESGLSNAASMAGNGAAMGPAVVKGLLEGVDVDWGEVADGYTSSDQYADALIAGDDSIWSLPANDMATLLLELGEQSIRDGNLYSFLLIYTPDSIPEDILEELPDDIILPTPPPEPPACPEGYAVPGQITRSGVKVAPPFPLVVGQDPDKTGVDLSFTVSVAPTIYHFWEEVPVVEEGWCGDCGEDGSGGNGNGAACHPCDIIVDWVCEARQRSYNETIPVAYASSSLTQESRDWILNTLSIRYPGAYLHNPSFKWRSSAGGSTWTYDEQGVQVADPGEWSLSIGGRTSGTPVSAARTFGGPAGSFEVYLKETAIIR